MIVLTFLCSSLGKSNGLSQCDVKDLIIDCLLMGHCQMKFYCGAHLKWIIEKFLSGSQFVITL